MRGPPVAGCGLVNRRYLPIAGDIVPDLFSIWMNVAHLSSQEVNKMSKRYPTLNTLGAETAMPLLGWLTRELDMSLGDMRNVRRHAGF